VPPRWCWPSCCSRHCPRRRRTPAIRAQADLRSGGAVFRFAVEVADTDATRARGLMFRESLPRFSGMLFVYPEPLAATFWMENTLIPLDMLFFDPAGRLTRIHENAVPLSREVIFGGENVLYVLEINGGLARTLGIAEGAEIRHPAIDPAVRRLALPGRLTDFPFIRMGARARSCRVGAWRSLVARRFWVP
jgi:uncharacterized protein